MIRRYSQMAGMFVLVIGYADLAISQQAKPAPRLKIDKSYVPADGERVVVVSVGAMAAASRSDLDQHEKWRQAKDQVSIDREIKAAHLFEIPFETEVVIIKIYQPPQLQPASPLTRRMTNQDFSRGLQESVNELAKHPAGNAVEVRVLGGPLANKVLFVALQNVGRLVEEKPSVQDLAAQERMRAAERKAEEKAKKDAERKAKRDTAPKPPPPTPESRAEIARVQAEDFLFDGRRDKAIEYFKKAIETAPDSSTGKKSKEKLKSLGVK